MENIQNIKEPGIENHRMDFESSCKAARILYEKVVQNQTRRKTSLTKQEKLIKIKLKSDKM